MFFSIDKTALRNFKEMAIPEVIETIKTKIIVVRHFKQKFVGLFKITLQTLKVTDVQLEADDVSRFIAFLLTLFKDGHRFH